jgi:excisionase family DNA binding protein
MGDLAPLRPGSTDPPPTPAIEPSIEVLFTRDALAEFLAVHPNTVDRLVKARRIAHYRIGRAVRFRVEDVEAFLAANRFRAR